MLNVKFSSNLNFIITNVLLSTIHFILIKHIYNLLNFEIYKISEYIITSNNV